MAPIVTSWSSLDYENGQQQRSNKLKQQQQQQQQSVQQQQQSSLSVYQPFRLRQNSVSVTPPSISSSLKSYGSVSSFESADPFASLLASTINGNNNNSGGNPGPTKPPRALYPPTSSHRLMVGGNRQHPPPLSIGAHVNSKFPPQGQTVCANRSKSHSDLSHVGTCTMEPVYCDNKCGQKVSRKQMMQHKAIECAKRLVACRYCAKDFGFDTLPAHHAKCGRFPIACPNQCDSPKVVREELESHLKDNCPALMVSCPFKEAGCRFKGPRFSLDKHQEEGMKQHLLLMCGLASRQQQQLSTLRSSVSRVSLNYSGTFLWRINDVQTKIAEARIKEGFELISAPFYTSQYGYKLQASLFLNGNGSGEGAYVSIYIKILPGEYDALLKWPFSHTVSFTLYDQAANPDKACNIVESFIPDPTWENFQRPSREPDALGFGFPRFVSHEMLKKRHFVKDDVLFLKVRVDPAKNMAV
ncbi:TNF receptor-associated factor 4-like isoform X1 [Daphnia pulicaria]|uniref:TNF receptor-associated factor 4-like isoform X1 n=1 Tax=Daphnia pulicaria TaxID=35523 RepID=UPI001EEC5577|nr:TNF receptor-associated factor 4-like isoform X1 [Daphnia pulicaria]